MEHLTKQYLKISKNYWLSSFQVFINNNLGFDLSRVVVNNQYKKWSGLKVNAQTAFTYKSYIFSQYGRAAWSPDIDGTAGGWFINGAFSLGYTIPIYESEHNKKIDQTMNTKEAFLASINTKRFAIEPGMQLKIADFNLTHCLDSTMSSGGYGSDFVSLSFGPYLTFQLPYNIVINTGLTFGNAPYYTGDFDADSDSLWDSEYEDWYLQLQGVNLSVGWRF